MRYHKVPATRSHWNDLHILEIASTVARLRKHASRALHEANYRTLHGWSRRDHAEMIRVLAVKIAKRRDLRLSCKHWVEIAEEQLVLYDKENPT